jgi:hypothetical protein
MHQERKQSGGIFSYLWGKVPFKLSGGKKPYYVDLGEHQSAPPVYDPLRGGWVFPDDPTPPGDAPSGPPGPPTTAQLAARGPPSLGPPPTSAPPREGPVDPFAAMMAPRGNPALQMARRALGTSNGRPTAWFVPDRSDAVMPPPAGLARQGALPPPPLPVQGGPGPALQPPPPPPPPPPMAGAEAWEPRRDQQVWGPEV